MSQDTDIDLILADCGDTFTAGDVTANCLFNLHDEVTGAEQQYPGSVMGMAYALIRTSAFPSLQEGDPVTVFLSEDGSTTNYTVGLILRVQDGRLSQVFLRVA